MTVGRRLKAAAISWGDSLFPPGPTRDRVTAVARRYGVTSASSNKGVPDHLRIRQVRFDDSQLEQVSDSLRKDFFGTMTDQFGPVDEYLATEPGRADWRESVYERLERNRATVVPWLDSVRSLNGLKVLEIGAGTGSLTLALAEQGASVSALDISERSLRVNELRCHLAGMDGVRYIAGNADEVAAVSKPGDHDMIIFSASLEHMTFDERMASLRGAWDLLEPGAYLAVLETPNRLWYVDDHTSLAPFFHWLPDEVAYRYAAYTPRLHFNTEFTQRDNPIAFARWGRGVSFHDFVLALGIPAARLPIQGSMHEYLDLPRWHLHTRDGRYLRFIGGLVPDIPKGFLYSYLDIVLKKPKTD